MERSLQIGDRFGFSRRMTSEIHQAFLVCSGDVNPLHVDDDHARALGHPGKLMHGALLNAMVSGFVGTALPVRDTLCLSQKLDFRRPFYLDELVELQATVSALQPAPFADKFVAELALSFSVSGRVIATGSVEVLMGVPKNEIQGENK